MINTQCSRSIPEIDTEDSGIVKTTLYKWMKLFFFMGVDKLPMPICSYVVEFNLESPS